VHGQLSHKMQKERSRALLIFSLATGFVLFQFLLQFTAGILTENLMRDFTMGAIGASVLTSAYYYTYMIMQTPAGYLTDRYGARKLLIFSASLTTLACLLFALSPNAALAIIARLIMGFGVSFVFVCTLFLCRNWFPSHMYPFLVALVEAIGLLGMVFANAYTASLITHVGWHSFAYACVAISLIFTILVPCFIRNTPKRGLGQLPLDRIKPSAHFHKDVIKLFTNFRAVCNGLYAGALMTPQTVFIASWGIPFLVSSHKLNLTQAAISSSFIFLGTAIAAPFFGWFYNYCKKPRFILALMALLTAALYCVVIFVVKLDYLWLCLVFFLIGITSNVYLWNYTLIHELEPRVAASTRIGFTNTLGIGVAPVLQLILGFVLHNVAHTHHIGSIHYAVRDYQWALSLLPILCVACAVLILFCKYKEA